MRAARTLSMVALVMLLVPAAASARPPEAPGTPRRSFFLPLVPVAGAHVIVSRLTPAPAGARPGHAYALGGAAVNEGSYAARRSFVVHRLRPGLAPIPVGGTSLTLPAHDLVPYRGRVTLPHRLGNG